MSWKDKFPKKNRYFETNNGILYCGDCLEIMEQLPDEVFNAIITDPPYGTMGYEWDNNIPFDNMWKQIKRIRFDNTPIIFFGVEPFSSYLRISNIKEYRQDLVWKKSYLTNWATVKKQFGKITENIIVFYKRQPTFKPQLTKSSFYVRGPHKTGHKKYFDGEIKDLGKVCSSNKRYPTNILDFKFFNVNRYHQAEKPVPLLKYLVETYTNYGDLILDFTCGSGTTLIASDELNRRWIGIDINSDYCEISKERLIEVRHNTNSLFDLRR